MTPAKAFVVKFSDGEYLADADGTASELLTDAHMFYTKAEADAAAANYADASAASVEVEYAPNWFKVGRYHQSGQLSGTWGGFAWSTWSNHFATQEEAQAKAADLNERDGIDTDAAETVYAVQEMEDESVKIIKLV